MASIIPVSATNYLRSVKTVDGKEKIYTSVTVPSKIEASLDKAKAMAQLLEFAKLSAGTTYEICHDEKGKFINE